jgi:Flp pilus assembly pilin Flp
LLHLIKMGLEAPVEETDERGNKRRSTRNRDEGRGTPQGSPLSPLLSNLYMRRFVLGWKKLGHEKRLQAYIINYADDLVICCRAGADEALARMRNMMSRLKLTVNEGKTWVCRLPEEKFDFLGYTFGRCYSPKTGRAYWGTTPSKKRVQRICRVISEMTRRSQTQQNATHLFSGPLPTRRAFLGSNHMTQFCRHIWSDDEGQDIAEYAVMLAVILVIVIGTIRLIGSNANNVFSSVANEMK